MMNVGKPAVVYSKWNSGINSMSLGSNSESWIKYFTRQPAPGPVLILHTPTVRRAKIVMPVLDPSLFLDNVIEN
jgi:hypothetical protein